MGFVYYGGHETPPVTDVYYACATWGDLEPEEGRYNWEHRGIRGAIERAVAEGRRVAIRVPTSWQNTDYPTPKWVCDLGVKLFDISETKDYDTFLEPEWWNPIYIEKYCAFIEALGKEFDGQPWLDYVDIRCYGAWGEGHRYPSKVPWPQAVDKREVIKTFIDAHLRAFRKTPLAVQMASDKDTPYPEGTAIDYALEEGCWMRRDGFGPFINEQEERVMKEWFPKSLVIAENAGPLTKYVRDAVKKRRIPRAEPISIDAMFDQILEFRCNYVPLGYGAKDWEVLRWRPDLLKKLWMNMGYRLIITEAAYTPQAEPGGRIKVEHEWENVGVGRLPVAYPVAFYLADVEGRFVELLRDDSFDETSWLAGKNRRFAHWIEVPETAAPGEYYLAVALVDPKSGEPAIALGIEGDDSERRYILGNVSITAAP